MSIHLCFQVRLSSRLAALTTPSPLPRSAGCGFASVDPVFPENRVCAPRTFKRRSPPLKRRTILTARDSTCYHLSAGSQLAEALVLLVAFVGSSRFRRNPMSRSSRLVYDTSRAVAMSRSSVVARPLLKETRCVPLKSLLGCSQCLDPMSLSEVGTSLR
jgi:hypothetical protein